MKSSAKTRVTSIKLNPIALFNVRITLAIYVIKIRAKKICTILLLFYIGLLGDVSMASSDMIPYSFMTFLIYRIVSSSSSSLSFYSKISTAKSRGVLPLMSLIFESAPFTSSYLMTLRFPFLTALCNGVYPQLSLASKSTPLIEIRYPRQVYDPAYTAQCRGVHPFLSLTFTFKLSVGVVS